MNPLRSKLGFTLIEVMVVTVILGVLSGVAVPRFFNLVEKTRQKVDLMKLYHLKNALNMALIEDCDALANYTPSKSQNENERKNTLNKLNNGLSSDAGATLFVIEVHNGLSVNIQGSHGKANNANNICQIIGKSGTWFTALKESGYDGVAEIIADRLRNKHYTDGRSYTSKPYLYTDGKTTYYRTAPKSPIFTSKALNIGKVNDNTRYTLNVRWTDPKFGGGTVEVFLIPNGGKWNSAYKTDEGVCFSTYGRQGCTKSK